MHIKGNVYGDSKALTVGKILPLTFYPQMGSLISLKGN